MLSNRSRIPPWPGIRVAVIFYLMVPLDGGGCQITDLGDHCRNGAGCAAGNHRIPHFFHMSSKYSADKKHQEAPLQPCRRSLPRWIFLGLKTGASLWRPNSMPAQYAQVSQPQELKNTSQTRYTPSAALRTRNR